MSSHNFALAPSVNVSRSKFSPPIFDYKTTFDNGSLIPIYVEEIYPGDTLQLDLSALVRMTTPVKPIMDNLFLDVYFFYVPNRLVWSHWEEFMGSNKTDAWTTTTEYTIPQLISPCGYDVGGTHYVTFGDTVTIGDFPLSNMPWEYYWTKPVSNDDLSCDNAAMFTTLRDSCMLVVASSDSATSGTIVAATANYDSTKYYWRLFTGFRQGTLADYMGVPIGTYASVSQLPFRAYGLIWNEFFRSEPYMDPVNIYKDSDSTLFGLNPRSTEYNPSDYVTSTVLGKKPLRVSRFHDYFSSVLPQPQFGDAVRIPFSGVASVNFHDSAATPSQPKFVSATGSNISGIHDLTTHTGSLKYQTNTSTSTSFNNAYIAASAKVAENLGTIQDLRTAFQINRYMETSGRSGSRYIEIIQAQFGVRNPDYRLQRPEYLGGFRKMLNISQVLQTSSTDSVTPQGNTGAYSLTTESKSIFTKSFTEHGYVIGLCCTRTARSYQQGLHKRFTRLRKLDYYFPVFAYLSEQPVYNRELYLNYNYCGLRSSSTDWSGNVTGSYSPNSNYPNQVFGYQEAWSEMRYHNSQVTSDFRSDSDTPLDFWHFSDDYKARPYASMDWLLEGPQNVDRTLAVTSSVSRQFLADFSFKIEFTRPMPLYSIPGLADHF